MVIVHSYVSLPEGIFTGWWFQPTLKNHGVKVSWDDDTPTEWKVKKIHGSNAATALWRHVLGERPSERNAKKLFFTPYVSTEFNPYIYMYIHMYIYNKQ